MKKMMLAGLIAGSMISSAYAGVSQIYVGAKGARGQNLYVIKCTNGISRSGVWQSSDGSWHQGSVMSGMGDRYNGLSIQGVAEKLCR
jgi:hypothetical protein